MRAVHGLCFCKHQAGIWDSQKLWYDVCMLYRVKWLLMGLLAWGCSRTEVGAHKQVDSLSQQIMQTEAEGWVELHPGAQSLVALIQAGAQQAQQQHRKPVVYVSMKGCGSCAAIHAHRQDPRMRKALAPAYVMEVVIDEWKEEQLSALETLGYNLESTPRFYPVHADARPVGPVLRGNDWSRSVPEAMAPVFQTFFERL